MRLCEVFPRFSVSCRPSEQNTCMRLLRLSKHNWLFSSWHNIWRLLLSICNHQNHRAKEGNTSCFDTWNSLNFNYSLKITFSKQISHVNIKIRILLIDPEMSLKTAVQNNQPQLRNYWNETTATNYCYKLLATLKQKQTNFSLRTRLCHVLFNTKSQHLLWICWNYGAN